jgi:hypothetical protein
MKYKKVGKCSLCGEKYEDYGHNPEPLKRFEERCCGECNMNKVIPARLERDWKEGKKENKKFNEGICKCGHHSKEHSWSLAPNCNDLECDKCNCQNFEPKEEYFDVTKPIMCEDCKKRESKVIFCNSVLDFSHGFQINLCRECFIEKIEKELKAIQSNLILQKKLLIKEKKSNGNTLSRKNN